jgi:hypothetical protein
MTNYKTVWHDNGSVTILGSDGNILDGDDRVQALFSLFGPKQDEEVIEMDDDLLSKLID